jgi:glyoxylase-like metal-dependent hydrolase (beta-lactamase superfamily II)
LRFVLIQPGLIEITPEEGVKDSRPTSPLLENGAFRVVIDTEHPKEDGTQYVAAFKRLGLSPADIDCVILTHLHPDHFGHKHLFPNATFVFHKDERLGFYFKNDRRVMLQGSALLDLSAAGLARPEYANHEPDLHNLGTRVFIRHAPGHTPGSVMIFASIDGIVHAWVENTFLNKAYFDEWEPPGSSWSQERVYEHMAYARDSANVIVPGHGPPFSIS